MKIMKFFKIGNIEVSHDKETKTDTLIVSSKHLTESISNITDHHFKSISISWDYILPDIDFLKDCPHIEKLSLRSETIKNFDGLGYLTNLKFLSLDIGKKSKLDLSNLTLLEELWGVLPGKTIGFSKLNNLKFVQVWGFNPPSKTISEIGKAENIEELHLIQANLESLEGIEKLSKLRDLEIYGSNKLKDISSIRHLVSSLTKLELENCKGIQDYSPIGTLSKLEWLTIVSCGSMESISFTKGLPKLKLFNFDRTNVEDGDLIYCKSIPEVYFTQKKHFSYSRKDLKNTKIEETPFPTVFWRERMEDGDDTFTNENINAVEKALEGYIQKINGLNENPPQKNLKSCVKEIIIKVNKLNEKFDYFIETTEREELVEFIVSVAELAGLEVEEDITEQWREW
jgi:hypothetical protein